MVTFRNPLALPGAALEVARRVVTLYATEGRDILHNSPDGWEVDRPAIWWMGNDDGAPPTWGNPPPGAEPSAWFATLPAVTRCTSIICDTLAGLPWHVLRGYEQLPSPDWLTDPQAMRLDGRVVGDMPSDLEVRLSAVEFWTNWLTAALWLGDGYVYAPVRDSSGQPKPPLWQFHPCDVQIKDGRYFVAEVELSPGSVLHLRGEPPYRGGHGNGVITRHAEDLGLAIMTRSYTEGMYSSGVPAGYLKSTQPHLEETEAKELKAKWMGQHGGSKRSIAVLNATTDFNPIQVSPLDSALDAARQWSLRDTALAFGVPPYMLGVPGDSSTYANVESRMIELRAFTLLPWVRRIESTLDAQFPRGTTLKIKTAGLERADTKTRFDAYKVGIDAGFLTADDVRNLEDMPPLEGSQATPTPPPDADPDPDTAGGARMTYTLDMEIRDVTEARREIVGRVAPYNETTYLTGDPRGERLMRGCFRASIEQRGTRIPLCIGHNHGVAAVGLSTRWQEDLEGLLGVFTVKGSDEGDRVLADTRDGYLPAMSVGFAPIPSRTRRASDGALEHTEAALKEVSLVVVGAYDGARVLEVRSAQNLDDLLAPFRNPPAVDLSPLPIFGGVYGRGR